MTEIEKNVLYYIGYSWNKEEIMRALNIDKNELERILKKYNAKISKNGVISMDTNVIKALIKETVKEGE